MSQRNRKALGLGLSPQLMLTKVDRTSGETIEQIRHLAAVAQQVKDFEWMPQVLLKCWGKTNKVEQEAVATLLRRAKETT